MTLRIAPAWAALLALVITLAACGRSPSNASPPSADGGGARAPVEKDFQLVAYQGESILGGRQGQESAFSRVFDQRKPVVLNFWAGQCPPCRAEMPAFQRVAQEFEGRAIFVGVDVGLFTGLGTQDDARRLLEELGIRYPAGYAVNASPLELYNVRNMPTTVFLTASGEVHRTHGGLLLEEQLRSELQRLVAP